MARGNFYVSLKQPYEAQKDFSSFAADTKQDKSQNRIQDFMSSSSCQNQSDQRLNDRKVYYSIIGTSAGIIVLALYQFIISIVYATRRKESNHG